MRTAVLFLWALLFHFYAVVLGYFYNVLSIFKKVKCTCICVCLCEWSWPAPCSAYFGESIFLFISLWAHSVLLCTCTLLRRRSLQCCDVTLLLLWFLLCFYVCHLEEFGITSMWLYYWFYRRIFCEISIPVQCRCVLLVVLQVVVFISTFVCYVYLRPLSCWDNVSVKCLNLSFMTKR